MGGWADGSVGSCAGLRTQVQGPGAHTATGPETPRGKKDRWVLLATGLPPGLVGDHASGVDSGEPYSHTKSPFVFHLCSNAWEGFWGLVPTQQLSPEVQPQPFYSETNCPCLEQTCSVAQAGFVLGILLPQTPRSWVGRPRITMPYKTMKLCKDMGVMGGKGRVSGCSLLTDRLKLLGRHTAHHFFPKCCLILLGSVSYSSGVLVPVRCEVAPGRVPGCIYPQLPRGVLRWLQSDGGWH